MAVSEMDEADEFLPRVETRLRRRALLAFQRAAYWSGLGYAFLRASRPQGAIILMYHSVAGPAEARWIDPRNRISPELFERQMAFLAARRSVVSMDDLLAACAAGESLQAGSVVLTFDDGYRDNLDVAAPILSRHGLPALLYLPTGLVERGDSPWADELYTIFRTRKQDPPAGELRRRYDEASGRLILAAPAERGRILDAVAGELDSETRPPRLTLSWDEVRTLRERHPAFALGAHSTNHVDLTAHGAEVLRTEVEGCVEDLQRELGEPPRHFAYPYNRRDDATDQALRASPLSSAVTADKDCLITGASDPLRLPRVDVPRSPTFFRYWTSGAHPELSKKVLGRA
jgi:peptidoglycan/xylan/chitin deacetylase (PgdA/CDA1 family)